MRPAGGQIVIFGKPGHAEVVGLTGQTDGTAIIVSSPNDIDAIDFSRPIRLYSQTTKSREEYQQLRDNIASRLPVGADFIAYLRRSAPNAVNFGIVVNEAAKNEIGFDETKTVNRLVEVFKTLEGGSVILFHEKDGQLTDAKKLF